ncbi:MAG: hypothetical protein WA775_12680 [Psychroserpens sp.]|uniref:hypothetical protein n=1 Tax=Psychroserpens sp. TaxID=2020870 RepID=UPI003C736100
MLATFKNNKKDILILLCMIVLPFAFFTYNLLPDNSKTFTIFKITIDAGTLEFVKCYVWLLSVKLLTLVLLSIWFITCQKPWRIILLIPISFEIYKFCAVVKFAESGLNLDFNFVDNFVDSLVVIIPYIILLIFFSRKIGYYTKVKNHKINLEINAKIAKSLKIDIKTYKEVDKSWANLKKCKKLHNKKDYLIKLIELRDQISIQ